MTDAMPPRIGRYTLLALLGQGAMGTVYRAYDPDLDRQVALKLVALPNAAGSDMRRRRFRREVRAAGRLNHPHIVTVFDVGLEHEPPYVVMELLGGGTLKDCFQRGPLPWREAVTLFLPLCQALAYAHQANIVHRDLKPANVMFTGDQARTLKLVDFGLAHWEGEESLTQSGQIVGTPAYMSLEQARGEAVDARADIYSLGIMLLEAITGRNPLDKGSSAQTWAAVISDAPIDLDALASQSPLALVRVIRQALEKDRAKRYHSVEALCHDLAECLRQPSGQAQANAPAPILPVQVTPSGPHIENPTGLQLPPEAENILQSMFAAHQRVVILKEFGGGFSGSQVLLVRPVRDDSIPERPAVIKLAPASLIQKEWQAFHECILDRLHDVAEARGEPVVPPGSAWGGLRYPFMGSGAGMLESLYHYCLHADIQSVCYTLEHQLFQTMESLWLFRRSAAELHLQAIYDSVLPVNLVIKPASLPPGDCHLLEPDTCAGQSLKLGDSVRLEGFVIVKVDPLEKSVTLNVPPLDSDLRASYRVRLEPVEAIDLHQVNNLIDPIEGIVTATRRDLLQDQVCQALGHPVDLSGNTIALPNRITCPNPLAVLPTLLRESRDIQVSGVHGDLNLDNVLVEHDGQTRRVHLIDFANARQDYVLHDLLRLETEVVTRLVPAALAEAKLPAEAIHVFYEQLHHATGTDRFVARLPHKALEKPFKMLVVIRKMARQCLFRQDDWQEYYQGLIVYLLSALKLYRLAKAPEAPLPKQVAFAGAAAVCRLIESPPASPTQRAGVATLVLVAAALLFAIAVLALQIVPKSLVPAALATPTAQASPSKAGLPAESIAVIGVVQGKVKVQRHENELISAFTGLSLLEGDVVTSREDSWAYIHCLQSGLFKLKPSRTVALTCAPNPPEGLALVASTLPPEVITLTEKAAGAGPSSLASLASVRGGSSRSLADLGSMPILLSPRQLTDDPRPTFRWTAVNGAQAYTILVKGKTRPWAIQLDADKAIVSGSVPFAISGKVLEAVYPRDAAPLEPKTTYLVTVQAHLPDVQQPTDSGELYFELIDQDTATALTKSLDQIQALAAPEDIKTYWRALLYQEHRLWLAAADQMEMLARLNPSSPSLIQMGDLYLKAGLLPLAEASYQRALDLARSDDDTFTQATALTGLGQVAYTAKSNARASEYLNQALALYRKLDEAQKVKAVENLLAEVK